MEKVLIEIIEHTKTDGEITSSQLQAYIRKYNQKIEKGDTPASKGRLLKLFLTAKYEDEAKYASWDIDPQTEREVLAALRIKPRRTASGVATIALITKPWTCSSNCLYCPCDVRMPKSYLYDEPACQRAERNFFDPYMQVVTRLTMLRNMGHVTDKVEFIVLGGTWTDYPEAYQTWFIKEMYRALNDSWEQRRATYNQRQEFYTQIGLECMPEQCQAQVAQIQDEVTRGDMEFNQAANLLYKKSEPWIRAAEMQHASLDELFLEHKKNEGAQNRVVGLVVETQPDNITPQSVRRLRQLGCTKAQIGVQTLDQEILDANDRKIQVDQIARAFELLRLYGFKIHAHFMANLYKANPESDKREFKKFVLTAPWQPDEIKLYPCALIYNARLVKNFEEGTWKPYTQDELMDVLVEDTLITPPFIRISRMIREFASPNIVDGNRHVNLREHVEKAARKTGRPIQEIRYREISTKGADVQDLRLDIFPYKTTVTDEYFLQWVTPGNKIAGFLRLSLPHQDYVNAHLDDLAIEPGEAMIREVHVYGQVAKLGGNSLGAQHLGLGRQLIDKAAQIAKDHGYTGMNVISSVGTRQYYRGLGFKDKELYQCLDLK